MAFKMKGYGYPGKSPIKDMKTGSYKQSFEKKSSDSPLYRKSPLEQKEDPNKRHFLEKEQIGPIEGEKKQLPIQPGEDPHVQITGGSQDEIIFDLEDRIEFVNEDLEEDPNNEELKATIKKLRERLEREYEIRDRE